MNMFKMLDPEIVIIDSSEEEYDSPIKKLKIEENSNNCWKKIKIENVTSLAPRTVVKKDEIVLIDDEESDNDCENGADLTKCQNNKLKEFDNSDVPSTSKENGICVSTENKNSNEEHCHIQTRVEFDTFIETCLSKCKNTKYSKLIEAKIPKLKLKYETAERDYVKSEVFCQLCIKKTNLVVINPLNICVHFQDIYQELKVRCRQNDVHELTEREDRNLKRLYKTLELIAKKIRELENSDSCFNKGKNSNYLKEDRYKKRFCEIYKMICTKTKENQYAGRLMHRPLDFSKSNYSAINRSLDRLYNKIKRFPTLDEVDKAIRKCVVENNINLSNEELDIEIRTMFEAMGRLVQRRRQRELEDIQLDRLDSVRDPAEDNSNLEILLKQQFEAGEKKMDAVFQKYTDKQENGEHEHSSGVESETEDRVEN